MGTLHLKTCKKCEQLLDEKSFYRDYRGIFSSRCRACHGVKRTNCNACGKPFEAKNGNILCSIECRKIYRPKTFNTCAKCKTSFVANRKSKRFCSKECWYQSKHYSVLHDHVTTKEATRAQRMVRYRIKKGEIVRPGKCEQCKKESFTEAAHFNYQDPLRVRWLCRSCHVKWDHDEPKGGTQIIERWQQFTGQKASLLAG